MGLINQRIQVLHVLRKHLISLSDEEMMFLVQQMRNENAWFDSKNIKKAIDGIIFLLEEKTLDEFPSKIGTENIKDVKLGLVLAGNIPGVGFHDVLMGFLLCKEIHVKLSSSDKILILYLMEFIFKLDESFRNVVLFKERLDLTQLSGIIATGSDNTARYFETYFSSLPNVIRKNRVSVAVIDEQITEQELFALGDDIFTYYGLGCRNVSKIFVPQHFDLTRIMKQLDSYTEVGYHHKYANNYDYNRSVYLVNKEPHLDNGFVMLKESTELVSPLSVLFYEYYTSTEEVLKTLTNLGSKIQVVVSNFLPQFQKIGVAQKPTLYDFPDSIDISDFILKLNK